jgi:hypothetical protein
MLCMRVGRWWYVQSCQSIPVLVSKMSHRYHGESKPPGDKDDFPVIKQHFPVIGLHRRLVGQKTVNVCVRWADVRPHESFDL